jgi:soluble lytic murein transglycosylase-like protein
MTTATIVAILIAVESGGNPMAVGDRDRTNIARGILQIRAPMRDEYLRLTGLYVSDLDLYDAPTSRKIATTILDHHARRLGRSLTLREACSVWNAGSVRPRTKAQVRAVNAYYNRALAAQRRMQR